MVRHRSGPHKAHPERRVNEPRAVSFERPSLHRSLERGKARPASPPLISRFPVQPTTLHLGRARWLRYRIVPPRTRQVVDQAARSAKRTALNGLRSSQFGLPFASISSEILRLDQHHAGSDDPPTTPMATAPGPSAMCQLRASSAAAAAPFTLAMRTPFARNEGVGQQAAARRHRRWRPGGRSPPQARARYRS